MLTLSHGQLALVSVASLTRVGLRGALSSLHVSYTQLEHDIDSDIEHGSRLCIK